MDYCSSCRRHLNGALVCPGCGAYAPDIAPFAADGRIVPAHAPTGHAVAADSTLEWEPDGGPEREPVPSAPRYDGSVALGEPEDAPSVPQGRAARRRQRERWKRNQRRAVVATAVALVGGGLTVASLDRSSGDRAQAATAPEETPRGSAAEQNLERTVPSQQRSDGHRSSSSRADRSEAPSAGSGRHRSVTAAPGTASPGIRPDAAASPRPTATPTTSSPTPSDAQTSSEESGPGNARSSAQRAPSGNGNGGSKASQDSGTPTPSETSPSSSPSPSASTSPSSPSTTPSQLCLLVVCLG